MNVIRRDISRIAYAAIYMALGASTNSELKPTFAWQTSLCSIWVVAIHGDMHHAHRRTSGGRGCELHQAGWGGRGTVGAVGPRCTYP